MVTPFDEDGARRRDAARRLARHLVENGSHGLVVAGTTGESPTLSDDEKLRAARGRVDEVGDAATVICGTGTNDTRHSVELTAAAARGRRRRRAGRHAVLQQAQPGRACAPTSRPSPRRPARCRWSSTTSPRARDQHAAGPARRARREIDNVVAVKQANNDELGPIEGLTSSPATTTSSSARSSSAAPAASSSPRTWSAREMREIYDAAQAGDARPRARDRRRAAAVYEALTVTTQPDPGQGGARDARRDRRRTLRLPMVAGRRRASASAIRDGARGARAAARRGGAVAR